MTFDRVSGPVQRRRSISRRCWLGGVAGTVVSALAVWARADALSAIGTAAAEDPDQPIIHFLPIGSSQLELQFAPGFDRRLREHARVWVRSASAAVAAYFGGFPVDQAEVLLTPVDGAGVRGGVSFGVPSPFIHVRLGRETTPAQLADDWVMAHEMVHLAIPRVPRSQHWLHEGIATYVESVARGRAGLIAPATVWRQWVKAMPQGQPQAGDAGLDHTPTWGRTYWGGAMFCLLADVQLLKRSHCKSGLQQALQGVIAAGGSYAVPWSVARILQTGDAAVDQTVLTELYSNMKDSSALVDLESLWRDLGVQGDALNDAAPLAAIRRAILS